ncbi:hypothetical protein EHW66_11035 [Erwinia psidii]|uniref:Uncharacterized protein n=1 Tax=Erwinia psidii TaxID=69224 RepID=A0A3N6V1A9_9GAMM|nr:hypothetical protein [Erwinia psidii]MCX8965516.1 hypothetical protein [Erwinia psidii]RQM38855.1 hypothetical protein EB241_06550 [Erwinia psidii]
MKPAFGCFYLPLTILADGNNAFRYTHPDAPTSDNDEDTRHTSGCGQPEVQDTWFNIERCPVFFDKDRLHFRRFAKYVAALWKMASSSSRSASWRLSRTFSAATHFDVLRR